jgi:two-component system, OmpR family, copper resistance phosphate regulon response regulator CusR
MYLKKGLEESGYVVDVATDGATGLIQAQEEDYDVIVLDVMLPTMDGWTVLKNLRASKATPVLFLTARDDVSDRVRGLELSGDDYLVKPFAFVELLARVRTLARRGPPRESDLIVVGDLEIDVMYRCRNSCPTHTTQSACGSAPRPAFLPVTEAERTRAVSGRHACRRAGPCGGCRAKIDDDFDVKLIQTVRGVGYVIDLKETG